MGSQTYERYFLFAVNRKLTESVSFCVRKVYFPALVRKVYFPALVRENVKFVLIFRTLKILPQQCGKINFPYAKLHRQS